VINIVFLTRQNTRAITGAIMTALPYSGVGSARVEKKNTKRHQTQRLVDRSCP
jgi:hypothetical protein